MEEDFVELEENTLLKSLNQNDFEVWLLKVGRLLKQGIYASFYKLHVKTEEHLTDRNLTNTRLQFILVTALQTVQALSFIFLGRPEMSNYSSVALFWEILGFTRADILFAYLGILDVFLYMIFVMIGLQLLWLVASVSASIMKGHEYELKILPRVALWTINFSCNYMFLPTLSVLLAELKGVSPVKAILNGSLNSAPWRQSLAGVLLICCLQKALFNELFSTEVRHDLSSFDFKARSTARFDLLYKLMLATLVITEYAMESVNPVIECSITLGLALLSAYTFAKYLPYFHIKANTARILASFSIAWWSVSYVLAYSINNAGVGLVLVIFVTPLMLVTVNFLVETRSRLLGASSLRLIENEQSLYLCELGLRPLIFNRSQEVLEIINLLKHKKTMATQKMLYIWEAHFCLGVLEDDRLARIKFSRVQECSGGFEADFHEYALNREFQLNEFVREDVVYLRYKHHLDQVKETDEHICNLLYLFWTDFQHFSLSRVRKYIDQVHSGLKLLHSQYKDLLKDFPNSSTVKDLYGSFLNDIGNNVDKGSSLLYKAEAERRALQLNMKATQLSFFDDFNGVLIISGSPSSFGRIAYCNLEAAEILGYSPTILRDMPVEAIIPPPFAASHQEKMLDFINSCTTSELNHSMTLFFVNKSKFIVECYSLLKCSALLSHPCFILLFRQKPSSSQMAIIDNDDCITCHSEMFPMYLGVLELALAGYHVEKFIPNYYWAKDNLPVFSPFVISGSVRMAMIGRLQIGKEKIVLLFVFSSSDEAEKWEKGSMHDEISNYAAEVDDQFLRKMSSMSITGGQTTSMLNVPEIKGVTFSEGNQVFTLNSVSFRENSSAGGIGSLKTSSLSKHRRSSITGERKNSMMQSLDRKDAQPGSSGRLDSSSMNSSFTNSIQFTTSVLGKQLFENVSKAVKLFSISYLAMVIAIVLTSVFTAVYFQVTISNQLNSVATNDIGAALYDLILLGESSRKLGLSKELNDPALRSLLEGDINSALSELEKVHASFKDDYLLLPDGNLKSRFTDDWILVWEVMDGHYISKKRNILDTLQLFIDHVSTTQGRNFINTPYEDFVFTDPNFLFLYRNGLGESSAALNSTLYRFSEIAQGNVSSLRTGTFICLGMIGVVYLVCLAITLPKIFQIQARASVVWDTLFSVPTGTLVELKRKALDRLRIYHSVDVDTTEENRRLSTKARPQLKDPVWRTFIGLMMLFAGSSMGFYGYIYAKGVSVTTDQLLGRAHQIELIYTNKINLLLAQHWSSEVISAEDPRSSIYVLQPALRHTTSVQFAFTSAYDNAIRARHRLRQALLEGVVPMKSSVETMMFDSVSGSGSELEYGLFAAELDYLENLVYQSQLSFDAEFVKLITTEHSIQSSLDDFSTTVINQIDDEIAAHTNETIMLFALYGIFSVAFYCTVTVPVLKWVNFRIKQAWRLTSLIPNDVMQTVIAKQ
jgi:hypothetical protein